MRIRRLLAACVLAGAAIVALPSVASADPGKAEAEHLRHCVEEALADTTGTTGTELQNELEDCHKAKSIVVPATAELLWGAIAFLIVAAVLMKYAFPMLKKTLKAREDKIRSDLEGAEQARLTAEQEAEAYRAQLADVNREAQRIVEESRADAERIREERLAATEAEVAELRARAEEDIRLATARAQTELQSRVKDLSIELAEKVVERNLDPDTQRALIDSYIGRVGSN
jgi:F-type H+-transporting ATPase subunit b